LTLIATADRLANSCGFVLVLLLFVTLLSTMGLLLVKASDLLLLLLLLEHITGPSSATIGCTLS